MVICKKTKKRARARMLSLEEREEKLFKTYENEIRMYAEIHHNDLLEMDAIRDMDALSKKYYQMVTLSQEIRSKAPWAITIEMDRKMEELARGWILLKKGLEIAKQQD
jgi:hypothetical protein